MENKQYPLYRHERLHTLKQFLRHVAARFGSDVALSYFVGEDLADTSFRDFESDVQAFGAALSELGLKGATVALAGENSYHWILTYFAVACGGGVVVPLDKDIPAEAIRMMLDQTGAAALMHATSCARLVPEGAVPLAEAAEAAQAATAAGGGGRALVAIDMERDAAALLERGRALAREGAPAYKEYMAASPGPDDLCAILYTSGTTDAPKAVMLTQGSIVRDAVAACENFFAHGTVVLFLPLHHTFALTASLLCVMLYGARLVIPRSLRTIAKDLRRYEPTCMLVVPLFLERFHRILWNEARKKKVSWLLKGLVALSDLLLCVGVDLRDVLLRPVRSTFGGKLESVICGGAPLDPFYVKAFRSLGINVLNGYGITECAPIISVNRNKYYRDGSVGLPLSCCKVRILDPDPMGVGEVCVQGANVMRGYYKNDDATQKAFTELPGEKGLWFRTGDLGRLDRDNFLYICGRIKNLIILSNGENIYPEELEALVARIAYVSDVVVKTDGEQIIAEVYPDAGKLAAALGLAGAGSEEDGLGEGEAPWTAAMTEAQVRPLIQQELDKLNRTLPIHKKIGELVLREKPFEKTTTMKIRRNVVPLFPQPRLAGFGELAAAADSGMRVVGGLDRRTG